MIEFIIPVAWRPLSKLINLKIMNENWCKIKNKIHFVSKKLCAKKKCDKNCKTITLKSLKSRDIIYKIVSIILELVYILC